jgi:putative ABC transport system permease protein
MAVALRLGWRELVDHRMVNLVMAQVIALSLLIFLAVYGYRVTMTGDYAAVLQNQLIVQQSNSIGEFYGSRLPPQVGDQLLAMGLTEAIPEIHAIAGTSAQDATLLRGVSLEQVARVEEFQLIEGRALRPGDAPRLTMIGYRLAQARGVGTGQSISLRGRDFSVVGIFRVGTYVDNEAWVSLKDAQQLLGWGQDVSVFVVPDEGIVQEGDQLGPGISAVRKGEAAGDYARQWLPLFDLLAAVTIALGVVVVIMLTSVLWRLAKLRQRELAIFRAVGFGKTSLAGYLLVQAAGVVGLGWLLGFLGVLALSAVTEPGYAGANIPMTIDWRMLLVSLGVATILTLGGVIVPVWWLGQLNVAYLLRSD